MGLFGVPASSFEPDLEKATRESNTEEDWSVIMRLCDYILANPGYVKEALRLIMTRVTHRNPTVAMQGLTVLDACVSNCGKPFLLEVASRNFEGECFRLLDGKAHPKVAAKLRSLIKKWAEGEFKKDSALVLIPQIYRSLEADGHDFSGSEDVKVKKVSLSKDPNVVQSQQEEDDIAKAIALSLKETTSTSSPSSGGSVYPSAYPSLSGGTSNSTPKKEPKKVMALYDFEAAEENELTFYKDEIFLVTEDSDAHWWRGTNHRGEGLFPANFVTTDLTAGKSNKTESTRKVSFSEEVTVVEDEEEDGVAETLAPSVLDPERIERVLHMLHDADPEGLRPDPPELEVEEESVNQMGSLINQELEKVDRKHMELMALNSKLKDALNLYHELMRTQVAYQPQPQPYYPPTSHYPSYPGYGPPTSAPYGYGPPPPQPYAYGPQDMYGQAPSSLPYGPMPPGTAPQQFPPPTHAWQQGHSVELSSPGELKQDQSGGQ